MPKRNKSTLSRAQSYREIGEFWDNHDVGEFWDQTEEVNFTVELETEITYYPLAKELSERLQSLARKQGVSSATLMNLWIQEKLQQREH